MAHANARLTPVGRMLLCQRITAGRPVAHVAAEMGISRTCAYRWWTRYRQHGPAGLVDRPSRAHQHPNRRVPGAMPPPTEPAGLDGPADRTSDPPL